MFCRAKIIIIILTLLGVFFTAAAPTLAATTITNPHLKYFGYYNTDGLPTGSANYIPEIATNLGNSNIYHVGADLDPNRMRSYLQSAKDKKGQALIGMFWVFFSNSGSSSNNVKANLDPNYVNRWNSFKTIVDPYINDIYGFYFDEPYWQGIQPSDFKTVTALIKRDYPSKAIMAIEAYPVIDANSSTLISSDFLQNVTDYGFDYYFGTSTIYGSNEPFSTYQAMYQKMKQVAGNRKIWLIPGTIGDHSTDGSKLAANFDDYIGLANSDTQVVGLLNFLYPRFGNEFPLAGQDYLKASSPAYNQSLTDRHKEVGKAIIANIALPVCTGDFNLDQTVDLLDYSIFLQNFLRSPLANVRTDLNGDGVVDLIDYSVFTQNFLHSCGV